MNKEILKGDIYFADLNPVVGSEQNGIRPVVIIQNNRANKYSPTVIVVPITTVIKKQELQSHVFFRKIPFLKSDVIVLGEQIRVIDKIRLKSFLGRLRDYQIERIDKALIKTLSIDCIKYLYNLEKEDRYVKFF